MSKQVMKYRGIRTRGEGSYSAERNPETVNTSIIWRNDRLFFLICLIAAIVAFVPYLMNAGAFAPIYDTSFLTSPLFCEAGQHLLQGRFPLFDWTILEPVSYDAHFSPLYPLYFVGLKSYCELSSSIATHDLGAVLHLVLMLINTVVLGRVAGLPLKGAIFAAVVFTLSPNAFLLARWPTLIAAAAWLPLAAAGLLAILYRSQWLLGTAMMSTGLGLMLVAAPATNLIASFVAFALILGVGSLLSALADGSWRRRSFAWAACGLVGIAAVALMAAGTTGNLLIVLDDLIRWNRTGYVIGREVTSEFSHEILFEQRGILDFASVLTPISIPFSVGSFFVGTIVACLGVIGAWDGRRDGLTRTLIAMVSVSLFLVFLDPFKFALIWSLIPGLNHTRHLSLLGGPFMIAATLLAARGFGVILQPQAHRARRGMVLALLVALPATFVMSLLPVLSGTSSYWDFGPGWVGTLVGTGFTAVALHVWGDRLASTRPGRLAAVLILGCSLIAVPAVLSQLLSISRNPGETQTWRNLDRMVSRLIAADPEPSVFVFHGSITSDDFIYTTAGTTARLHGFPTFQYYHSPRVHWKFFAQNYLFPDFAAYARMGGRYLLAEGPIDDPQLVPVGQEGTIFAYRLRDSRPMVVATCGIPPLPLTASDAVSRLRPSQLPLAPPAVLAAGRAADAAPGVCAPNAIHDIRIDRSRDALRFDLTAAGAQMLVLNLPPYEGWRLSIGGTGVPLFALDDSRLVAVVPPGVSGQAALLFRPIAVMVRMAISAVSTVLVVIVFLWLAWRRPGPWRPLRLPAILRRSTRPADIRQTPSGEGAPSCTTSAGHGSPMRAVILAGGIGSRLRPYTLSLPKPLLPIGERPILEIIIRQLASQGFTHITLAVNHQADLFSAFFGDGSKWGVKITYSLEREALGTMGPLRLIEDLPEHFLIMNGDVLTDLDYGAAFRAHVAADRLFTIFAASRKQKIDFGVLHLDDSQKLVGFEEKPELGYTVSMGIYAASRRILDRIPAGRPFGFDHLMLAFLASGDRVDVQPHGGYWLDIGRPDDYERASEEWARHAP